LLAEIDKVYEGMAKLEYIYSIPGTELTGAEGHSERKINLALVKAKDRIAQLAKPAGLPARGFFERVPFYRLRLLKEKLLEKGRDYAVNPSRVSPRRAPLLASGRETLCSKKFLLRPLLSHD
jgi:hypothetical protein